VPANRSGVEMDVPENEFRDIARNSWFYLNVKRIVIEANLY